VGCGGMEWLDVAQVRDRWRERANAVMNLRVPQNAENCRGMQSHPSTTGHTGQTVIHIHPQHRYWLSSF
jgi:hypothetical protein